jgi:hypothetical protein
VGLCGWARLVFYFGIFTCLGIFQILPRPFSNGDWGAVFVCSGKILRKGAHAHGIFDVERECVHNLGSEASRRPYI